MRVDAGTNSLKPPSARIRQTADPFDEFLNSTMSGGTSVVALMPETWLPAAVDTGDYITLRVDVILEYERTILELRQQLLHYKRLMYQLLQQPGPPEEYADLSPVLPIDAASIRIVNSILSAHVPPSAAFVDFEEGEL